MVTRIWRARLCSTLLLCLALPACASGPARSQYDEASRDVERDRDRERDRNRDEQQLSIDEATLARETRVDVVMRIVRARNPDVAEARERSRSAIERARSVSHWPDPQVSYQLWQQPIARPVSFGDANMHMLSVRQTIPAPGSVDARARAALSDANIVGQTRKSREQDVASQARRAYATYYAADREKVIHLSHIALATELVDLARANYAAGKGTQQDVLRLLVELSKLHNDIAAIDQRLISTRAELNALMGRASDAPLGPPTEIDVAAAGSRGGKQPPPLDQLEKDLRSRRPELVGAIVATRRAQAQLDEAKSRARWPELMVGVDYMLMPQGHPDRHNYGAMIGMTVPWLNPAHAEETRAAEHAVAAERHGVAAIETTIIAQLHDAAARLESARRTLVIIDRDLLPQSRASFESARAGYATGNSDSLGLIDALRSYLDVQLERARAASRVEASIADLERAAGTVLSSEKPDANAATTTKGGP